MNIYNIFDISQSSFVISTLVWRCSQGHPKISLVLRRVPKLITITPTVLLYQSLDIPVTPVHDHWYHCYSEGWPECPPRVWHTPETDSSKYILHILADAPGGFQWPKNILLMYPAMRIDDILEGGSETTSWERWSVYSLYDNKMIHLPHCLPNINSLLLSPSPFPMYICTPHYPFYLCHLCISAYPSSLSPLASWVAGLVRSAFSHWSIRNTTTTRFRVFVLW